MERLAHIKASPSVDMHVPEAVHVAGDTPLKLPLPPCCWLHGSEGNWLNEVLTVTAMERAVEALSLYSWHPLAPMSLERRVHFPHLITGTPKRVC